MPNDFIDTPYGSVTVGQLCQYTEIGHGVHNGLYPYTTTVPTVIYYDEILPFFADKTTEASNIFFNIFYNLSFNSMDDVVEYLSTVQGQKLVTDIYWFWGAPDVGGLGMVKTGADSYSTVYVNGYVIENDKYKPLCNSLSIPNAHNVTITNSVSDTSLTNVPASGTYRTGISFYYGWNCDSNTGAYTYDGYLRFNNMSIFPCTEGGLNDQQVFTLYSFTDVGENLSTSWTWEYYAKPYSTNLAEKLIWQVATNNRWSINAYYPYWGLIDITNTDYVDGTSLFGGESSVIDDKGNPYDVYEPWGSTGSNGGYGPQDRYSQDTLPEGHPALNLLNSGFVKLYNPSLAKVQQFSSFLFSGITEDMASAFKRMITNPIDYILALNMIHIPLTVKADEDIGFCGISSGVSAPVVTEQYYEIEYTLDIREFWNTALDYSSYTKCKIYVPYCGIYDITVDEIMNGTLWLRYVVDVVSGSVVAFVGTKRKQKDGTWLRATLYQYNGNCILSMPVSQTNWQNTFASVLNIASMAIAPSPATAVGMAESIMGQKVSVSKSGSISANFGYLGKQTPYVILERPELSLPVDYGKHEGYPANHKRKLSEVHGYTEVKENTIIHNNFSGTDEEMEMLKQLLQSGIYLD